MHKLNNRDFTTALLRPFYKLHFYYDRNFIESPGLQSQFFPPKIKEENVIICISGTGANKENGLITSSGIVDYNSLDAGSKCFPLYYYEEREKQSPGLFDATGESEYIRRDGVSDFILERARKQYGKTVNKEDIFYYVYGILHSPDYRETFANDLKKMLPRLPLLDDVRDFWAFSKAGRKLAELHIDYEEVPTTGTGVIVMIDTIPQDDLNKELAGKTGDSVNYRVEKMRFPKKGQKDTIIYNSQITITNIPERAYDYVVNGKSAIEWIMERYQVTTHKDSGITNDPNDWAKEVGNPRYILDLLLSIINVSLQTVEIVEGLPKLEFEN